MTSKQETDNAPPPLFPLSMFSGAGKNGEGGGAWWRSLWKGNQDYKITNN